MLVTQLLRNVRFLPLNILYSKKFIKSVDRLLLFLPNFMEVFVIMLHFFHRKINT